MLWYPFAPYDNDPPNTLNNYFFSKRTFRNQFADQTPMPANARPGTYFKQAQFRSPGERGLITESVHGNLNVAVAGAVPHSLFAWPYAPEGNVSPYPQIPDGGAWSFDFNRHGKKAIGNAPTDPSMNLLYCDGHAGFVSCRETYHAMRMK
jgi:prepilin-type processing-associated H-X9-DG protein